MPVRISQGASHVTFYRPTGVAVWVHVSGGLSKLSLDDQHFGAIGGDTRLETPDYGNATDRYDVKISVGASDLTITTW